jgi:hypothetical protein
MMASQPTNSWEWLEREEQAERREEAMSRKYRRRQYELYDEIPEYEFPECPNCGEHAQPVYGISEDLGVGYSCEEQACVACMH